MPLTTYTIERIVRLHNQGHKPAVIVRILAKSDRIEVNRQAVEYHVKVGWLFKI